MTTLRALAAVCLLSGCYFPRITIRPNPQPETEEADNPCDTGDQLDRILARDRASDARRCR